MKPGSTIFLQAVLVLSAMVVLVLLIRFPLTEGRAENLDLFSIYLDPLILYGYAASIPFFIALFKAFRLLGYIRQNKLFSPRSARTLKSIKYCAYWLSALIIGAGIYIRLFHARGDDPAGFIALCLLAAFIAVVVANMAAVFEKIVQQGTDIQSENESLKEQAGEG
ncbi:MAG: DUF2975 domain-containing protein [Sphingobacteriales bacterium]|nr:DUF2975 domain-containing protein [Sphingobacteriales bacterium]